MVPETDGPARALANVGPLLFLFSAAIGIAQSISRTLLRIDRRISNRTVKG
jgi:hypothetical protein